MKKPLKCSSQLLFILILPLLLSSGCKKLKTEKQPNIILIMADDMGYECISTYGSLTYSTPVLDSLAANGMKFSNCISQPLCTPSRVKIMTGLYNYRNYDYFGHLNSDQFTFGNLMQEAGYKTCIAGKWQLNGLSYKKKLPHWNDNSRPVKFGFDEYCLWQLTVPGNKGGRYADPLIEQNGEILDSDKTDYGPDIFSDYILDFIERNQDVPFFVYYPMVLVHDPFVPTPDSDDWTDSLTRTKKDTSYFKDMVAYTDKIVGRISEKLKKLNLDKNTILIFTGDNGTHYTIYSQMPDEVIRGAKGNTIEHGIHVPLIVYWPDEIKKPDVFNGLIEFSDFFPTFAELAGVERDVDGTSFLPLLEGRKHIPRETAFVHYDPRWGKRVNQYRNRFVMTTDYKLYQDGAFYDIVDDNLEEDVIIEETLTEEEKTLKEELKKDLEHHKSWK